MKMDKKILIIDDEAPIAELIYEILQPVFEVVDYVTNSEHVQSKIDRVKYDVILSDVNMPNIPGPELVRLLRSQGKLMPIFFITGCADLNVVLTALRLGVFDVIEKPFNTDTLVDSITRAIEMDVRRERLIIDSNNQNISPEKIEKQKKMLGLFMVMQDRKKSA
jgi:DNA-binding NtrC family response regulator